MKDEITITNNEYWFKVVHMLQQNWALIESAKTRTGCIVYFVSDTSGVFDQLEFDDIDEAEKQLRFNGFGRFAEDSKAKDFITPPSPPFHKSSHPRGRTSPRGSW